MRGTVDGVRSKWVGNRHCDHIVACLVLRVIAQLVVIIVEDLQWVDSGTLDMILAFLQEAGQEGPWDGGCMFLLSTRPASTFPAHLSSTRDKIVAERFVRHRTNPSDDDTRSPLVRLHRSLGCFKIERVPSSTTRHLNFSNAPFCWELLAQLLAGSPT